MATRIRFASWNIENYGYDPGDTTKPLPPSGKHHKSPYLPQLIAKTMEIYNIDILAIIEMKVKGHDVINQQILTELNNSGYKTNWQEKFVFVGKSEGVSFFWHEPTPGSPIPHNAFVAKRYTNNAAESIAYKVLKDSAGNMIYFPDKSILWGSLPGKPDGRRPAFCAFTTNGGATTFTFLDIHTPYATTSDVSPYIQAYSCYLYPTSREVSEVQTFDSIHAVIDARTQGQTVVEKAIANEFSSASPTQKQAVAVAAIDAITRDNKDTFINRKRDEIVAGIDFQSTAKEAAEVAAASAAKEAENQNFDKLKDPMTGAILGEEAVVEAGAAAGAAAATYVFAKASTTPNPDTEAAMAATKAVSNVSYVPPTKKAKNSKGLTPTQEAAAKAAEAGVNAITFNSVGGPNVSPVNASLLAGDFNINYPDTIDYSKYPGASKYITGSDKAYSELLTLAGSNKEAINQKTTQKGKGGENNEPYFKGARVYKLKNPNPLDPIPPSTTPNGVPQDVYDVVDALKGKEFMGYEEWQKALADEAIKQGVSPSDMDKYKEEITNAFDTEFLNQTDYFRSSAYDNIFVKNPGSTIVPNSGKSIDMLSELGSWKAYPNPDGDPNNYWQDAKGGLKTIANTFLVTLALGNPETPEGIDVEIPTAVDAGVFYKRYMSDHYPVIVEVTIP